MKNLIFPMLCILLFSCTNTDKSYEFSKEIKTPVVAVYDTEWRELQNDELIKIGQAITSNNIKGCGTMYIKSDGEQYLVACYSDLQKKWNYYEIEFRDGIGNLTPPKETSKKYLTKPKV
jgi:hypothetical protein